jgi:hypothetical protein
MNRITKEQRDQILLVTIGTLGLCVGLWFLLIGAQRVSMVQSQARYAAAKNKVEKATNLIRQKDAINKTLIEHKQVIDKIESDLASGDIYAWFILTLNKFLEGHKVTITRFSRETMTPIGTFPSFPYRSAMFTVVGVAFFHDLGTFLADFENQFPYFRIQNLDLSVASGGQTDKEMLSFTMEIIVLLRQPETKGP